MTYERKVSGGGHNMSCEGQIAVLYSFDDIGTTGTVCMQKGDMKSFRDMQGVYNRSPSLTALVFSDSDDPTEMV
jgi:hypothetical protein